MMNWKEKRKLQREAFRLKASFGILIFLLILLFLSIWSKIPWQTLPSIIPPKSIPTLAPIPQDDPILKLSNLLSQKGMEISVSPTSSDSAILINLASGETIIFSTIKDMAAQVDSLQIILARLTIEGKKLKTLDFRYDKPVVTY